MKNKIAKEVLSKNGINKNVTVEQTEFHENIKSLNTKVAMDRLSYNLVSIISRINDENVFIFLSKQEYLLILELFNSEKGDFEEALWNILKIFELSKIKNIWLYPYKVYEQGYNKYMYDFEIENYSLLNISKEYSKIIFKKFSILE